MIASASASVLRYELRRYVGRWSYLCALLLVVVLTNVMWVDPDSGNAMLTVNETRVLYDSAVMAVMFSSNLMIFIGLVGFYLIRGGVREDWSSGMGSILAALPVSNFSLLLGRWIAGILCLSTLSLTALLVVLAMHALRVHTAPMDLPIYIQTWFWMSLPCLLFASSAAIFCDSYAPLNGRLGDVLYFAVWMGSGFAMEGFWQASWAAWNPLLLVDFAGHGSALVELVQLFGQTGIGVEHSHFIASRAPLTMPGGFWTPRLIALRCAAAAIAVLPFWLGVRWFHRYSPDILKNRKTSQFERVFSFLRRLNKPMDIVNGLSAPFTRGLRPTLAAAGGMPGLAGRVAVECLLTLLLNPIAVPAVLLCWALSLSNDTSSLGEILLPCLVFWGILICDISTRDRQAGWEKTGASYPGGLVQLHWRKLLSSFALGLLICLFVLLRWAVDYPTGACALLSALWVCSAIANFLGRRTGLPRPFLAFFLCGLWLSENLSELPVLDFFGIHGLITAKMIAVQFAVGWFFCVDILFAAATRAAVRRIFAIK